MIGKLKLGHFIESEGHEPVQPFEIPLDGVTKAFAIVGIRESGKSSLGTVMAEEYCKAKQPWIAFDPAGNWWGLRALPDGRPGGFPVVVFGGERGDLPLEKDAGRKIAEAITAENVFAVIDLKLTSKTMWRTLVRDIVKTLQEIQVELPRMVFLEEAQEFLPQRPSHQLGAECKEIVERLVTLGGNWGYGATILGQRPASIEKSALSQCETVFAFATQGSHDRKALLDWMESQQVDDQARRGLERLADLETGTCYVWSPRFLKTFAKLRIRRRETMHPREARKMGVRAENVELAPVREFVQRLSKQLTRTVMAVPATKVTSRVTKPRPGETILRPRETDLSTDSGKVNQYVARQLNDQAEKLAELEKTIEGLKLEAGNLRKDALHERGLRLAAEQRLEAVRAQLRPQFDVLQKLFGEIGEASTPAGTGEIGEAWGQWLSKAGTVGCKGMLEILIRKGRLKQVQLATLAGVKFGGSTWRAYRSWMTRNHLATLHEDEIEAVKL